MGVIKQQGIQNTIISYFGIAIGFINLVVLQPYFLTTEEIGLVRVLFSFSILIASLLPIGIGNVTVKFFPGFRNAATGHYGFLGIITFFVLLGTLLAAVAVYSLKNVITAQYAENSPLFTEYFNYVLPFSFILCTISVLTVYSASLLKTSFPTFLNDILGRVLFTLLISVYYLRLLSLDQFIFLFVMIYGTQSALLLTYILRIDKPRLKPDIAFIKTQPVFKMLRYGLILSVTGLASLGIKYIDSVMLGTFLSLEMVGVYAVAAFIPAIIETPLTALEKIANPKIAYAWAENNIKEIKEIYYKSCHYLMIIGGLLLLFITTNIVYLLQFLPAEFEPGAKVVWIISIGIFCNISTGVNNSVIFNSDKYLAGTWFLYLLIVLTVFTNWLLIPIWGIAGAAWATSLSIFIYNTLKFSYIWYKFRMQPFTRNSLFIVLSVAAALAVNYFLPDAGNVFLNLLIRITAIPAVYLAFLYFFRVERNLYNPASVFKFIKGRF